MYIVKLASDATGIDWQRTFGGTVDDVANAVVEVSDGYVMAGYTNSYGETGAGAYDVYIVKYDLNGNYQWNRVVGLGDAEYANSIVATLEGGFAIAGYRTNDPNSDILLLKIDASGNVSAANSGSDMVSRNNGNVNVNAACANTIGGNSGTPSLSSVDRGTHYDGTISSPYVGTMSASNHTSGTTVLGTSCGPFYSSLPIELINFFAICDNNKITLDWNTATEENNDYFTIERSADGITFSPLLNIPGSGNSSTIKNYSAVDNDPLNGTSYYRLKQTDYNGQSKEFPPVSVSCNSKNGFAVNVNNSSGDGSIYVAVTDAAHENVLVVMRDVLGRELYSKTIVENSGAYLFTIDNKLSPGVYFITASNKEEYISKKIMVR